VLFDRAGIGSTARQDVLCINATDSERITLLRIRGWLQGANLNITDDVGSYMAIWKGAVLEPTANITTGTFYDDADVLWCGGMYTDTTSLTAGQLAIGTGGGNQIDIKARRVLTNSDAIYLTCDSLGATTGHQFAGVLRCLLQLS